jgi:hypothetical protein
MRIEHSDHVRTSHQGHVAWLVLAALLGAIVGYAIGADLQKSKNIEDNASTASTSAAATSTTTPATSASTATTAKRTNQLVVALQATGGFDYYYYNLLTNKFIEKVNVTDADAKNGSSVYSNSDVQFVAGGTSYYINGQFGCMDDCPLFSKLIRASDKKVMYEKKDSEIFERWIVKKDGTKIYVAVPSTKDTDVNKNYDLMAVDTNTFKAEKLVSMGVIASPLHLNTEESSILTTVAKERTENNIHYYDYYIKTVDLANKKMNEKLIWRAPTNISMQYSGVESLAIGPKFLKTASMFYDSNTKQATLRTIDLGTLEEKDIYTLKGNGQSVNSEWSSDGMKIAFSVTSYGGVPEDQGVLIHDFNTNTTTQVLKSNITMKNTVASGEFRLVKGSFDGQSFAYIVTAEDRTKSSLKYYDGNTKKSYDIANNIDWTSQTAFRY